MKIRRFMKKRFRYGEKGFTLIELLIVVAILGILAAVIVPNLATFLGTGQVAAANTEVANVETAALAYYADNSTWPANTNTDLAGGTSPYLSAVAVHANYGFDSYGRVSLTDGVLSAVTTSIKWDLANHKWIKV